MLNKILISCAIFLLTIGVKADELTINPDHPETYTVVKGDTLWDISARFLEQPWRWSEIWNVNPQIENPHLIYPGDVVSLSYQDGQPVLSVNRGTGQVVSGRNVKLSPTVRSFDNVEAIPAIPIDAIQQFLKRPVVLDENEIEQWPYVVSSYDEHLIASTGNTIYVRGIAEDSDAAQYSIFRKGNAYVSPKENEDGENEILGYEAIYIGDATLTKKGDPAAAIVTEVDQEILIGDRLVPQSDEDVSTEFYPGPTIREVEGNILSVVDGVSQIGQYQVVVLSLGEEQGLEAGNVLGIYQSGYVVQDKIGPNRSQSESEKEAERAKQLEEAGGHASRTLARIVHDVEDGIEWLNETFPTIANQQAKTEDVTLPEEYVGVVMVFRTFNKVSYALVMETQGPVHVSDTVRSL
ncbi:MAG: LysM peptidoglycan-binding domain-containing protein [Proteobacteria bacterium]|nr:LysM peptidoglycan-binding domain-containing protein [Pseudomonadota bacterium]NOG60230.1 LysM peptidoglycan-binding domain-containing protein [Pseudomonadota bacterium]